MTETPEKPKPLTKARWILPILLLPMNALIFVPATLLWLTGYNWVINRLLLLAVGCVLLLCGMSLAAWTVWLFHSIGRGTAAPWDPPARLVVAGYGNPDIFNTDQGSQFTSAAFTKVLRDHGIRISMDGRGRWLDDVFIERLWRSLKYESIYLHAYETGSQAREGIGRWIAFYNNARPHSSLGGITPTMCYEQALLKAA